MRTGVEETLHSGHIRMKMSCCCCQCCRQTRMETAGEDPQTRSLEVPAAALEFLNSSKESGVVTGRSLKRDGAEGPPSW